MSLEDNQSNKDEFLIQCSTEESSLAAIHGECTTVKHDGLLVTICLYKNQYYITNLELIKDETLKSQLIGISKDSSLTVNISDLFNGNETVISNSLGIAKEAVNDLNKNFFRLRAIFESR